MTNEELFGLMLAIETDECVLWPKGRYTQGYGAATIQGRTVSVHRAALIARCGPPPAPKLDAAHMPGIGCQRHCMNYRHLRWATRRQNALDSITEGTRPHGQTHHTAKLNDADVAAIRASMLPQRVLARMYQVHPATISRIRNNQRWVV